MSKSSVLRPTLVLGLISLVVSGLVVLTYNITGVGVAGPAVSEEVLAGAAEVLPSGEGFEDALAGANENVLAIVKTSNDAGFVINSKGKGYGGDLGILVGIDNTGTITGIKVMSSAETPGIGTKVTEDEAFLSSYVGQTGATGNVVSGATLSSNALNEAVSAAMDAYNVVKDGGTLDGSAPTTSGDSAAGGDTTTEEPVEEVITIDNVIESASKVLADGEEFEQVDVTTTDNVKFAVKATNGAGYVINVVSEGFGGEMNLIVGFDSAKNITGVHALSIKETEGLGTKVLDAEVIESLIGKSALETDVVISGATVSADAFNVAIRAAVEAVQSIKDLSSIDTIIEVASGVLPSGDGFEDAGVASNDNVKFVVKATNGAGYVVNVVSTGFIDEINFIIGFDSNKNITGVQALAIKETEGLGTKILDAEVIDTLIGKSELEEEVAISGATVSSDALNTAVKAAIEAMKGVDA